MMTNHLIAAGSVGSSALNLGLFVVFAAITLFVVYRVSTGNSTAADYYAAGSSFTGTHNGAALSGDVLSAAFFLGIPGLISVFGYDGIIYAVAGSVSWLVGLLLLGERLRNTGRFTIGDVMAFRTRQRPVRAAAAITTLVISLFYLPIQMSGAGSLVALLLNITSKSGQALAISVVGLVMIGYVLLGGMRGTTWVQIIKAALLLLCVTMMAVFLTGKFGFSPSRLLTHAADNNPLGQVVLAPGAQHGATPTGRLDFVSLALSLMLGICGLPHVLMRFYTVPDAKEARRSTVSAAWVMMACCLCTPVLGFGAMALVGPKTIAHAPGGANSAVLLLALRIGGPVLLSIVAAIAFATILAVVAGLTLAASTSFAHDVYANLIMHGKTGRRHEVRVARLTAVVVGVLAIVGGVIANGQNLAFLVSLPLAMAASATLPTLLYSIYWKRFNTTGTLCCIYGGLITCVVLIAFSPVFSGAPTSIVHGTDFHWFPLSNPGIVAIPLSFGLGALGTMLSRRIDDRNRQPEMEVRSLTGIGAVTHAGSD